MMKRSAKWPFRQNDRAWAKTPMWDRAKVIEAHMRGNGASQKEAERLLRGDLRGGNCIAYEGCLVTSLAMVLRLLDEPARRRTWTPARLNDLAHKGLYYTLAGISMVPLYADLVAEVTGGEAQMCAKEEYFAGEPNWPRQYASTSGLVRAYRQLPPNQRRHFAVMLKTGTYDDSLASHYVLLDPDQPGSPDEDDANLLDPAMPRKRKGPWRLSDSAKQICKDNVIKAAWLARKIKPTQIGGAWLFARWRTGRDRMLLDPIVDVCASRSGGKG